MTHITRTGDCISSIAFEYGFLPETIWNDPANAELKRLRKNLNTLCVDDKVVIPQKRLKTQSKPSDQRHRFRRKAVPEVLRIQFLVAGSPRANQPYQMEVDGKILSSDGTSTDADGFIEHPIPPGARRAVVRFNLGAEQFVFRLGELEPLNTVAGVKGRLKCLGFFDGDEDEEMTAEFRAAISEYQGRKGLAVTGEPDENTQRELEADCGG